MHQSVTPQTASPEPTLTPEPEPSVVKLTLAGDLVMHSQLNSEVLQPDGSYDYSLLFEDVEHYVSEADYALCCLEASMTGTPPWTGYPMFTVPDDLAYSLKDVGFDLINMASNHSMDGWKAGIDRTLDVLDEAGLDHVGTYRTQAERDENNGILVKEINGVSFAFLDYTYGTNGIPVDGFGVRGEHLQPRLYDHAGGRELRHARRRYGRRQGARHGHNRRQRTLGSRVPDRRKRLSARPGRTTSSSRARTWS